MKKAYIDWTSKQIVKMVEKDSISFDNAVQRGMVWDNDRKSLFIHSLIYGYPVPPFYALRSDDGKKYDMLDGKQRLNAISEFVKGNYTLSNVPEIATGEDEETELVNIEDKKFEELPENFQDAILSYGFRVYYFEDITDDEISDMFFRLNNGKPLTAVELTRVKAKSRTKIQELAQHDIFKSALTEKAMQSYKHEDIIMRAFAILTVQDVSLENKALRPFIINTEMSDEQKMDVFNALTRIYDTYNTLIASNANATVEQAKATTKIAKRLLVKTHLISLVTVALKSIQDEVSITDFTVWAKHFFSGKTSASIDKNYNSHASSKSGVPEAVRARLQALETSYNDRGNIPVEKFDEEEYIAFTKEQRGKMIDDTSKQYNVAFEDFDKDEQKTLYMAHRDGKAALWNTLVKKKYKQLEDEGIKGNKRESA